MTGDRAEGVRVAYPLFQAGGGGSTPTSALQLIFRVIDIREAKPLNSLWHSRLPRLGDPNSIFKAGVCFGADFGGVWYAVAVWSRPVARLLPSDGSVLELRRLAVAPDAPRNTPTRMLGWMARWIARERPAVVRLVSYQDTEAHTGGIYRGAGWRPVVVLGSRTTWEHRVQAATGKRRPPDQSKSVKVRWEKLLRPEAAPHT